MKEKIKLFITCRKCGKVEDEKRRGKYPCSNCECIVYDLDSVICNKECALCSFEKNCIEKEKRSNNGGQSC